MLATLLGGVAAYCLFVPLEWGIASFRVEQLVSLFLYSTSSAVIIWAAQSYRGLLQRLRTEEAARKLLNLELVHRNRNILAVVQAIICQTIRDNDSLFETVSARLAALGATNDLLVRSEWQSAPLREILVQEFAPYGLARFRLRGDEIECPYAVAILLAMMIHELTTNAVKYGALSNLQGQVAIEWSLVDRRLTITWVETGGPKPTISTREGFGIKLMRSGLRQFDGSVDRRYETAGLQCRISLCMPEEAKGRRVTHQASRGSRFSGDENMVTQES